MGAGEQCRLESAGHHSAPFTPACGGRLCPCQRHQLQRDTAAPGRPPQGFLFPAFGSLIKSCHSDWPPSPDPKSSPTQKLSAALPHPNRGLRGSSLCFLSLASQLVFTLLPSERALNTHWGSHMSPLPCALAHAAPTQKVPPAHLVPQPLPLCSLHLPYLKGSLVLGLWASRSVTVSLLWGIHPTF